MIQGSLAYLQESAEEFVKLFDDHAALRLIIIQHISKNGIYLNVYITALKGGDLLDTTKLQPRCHRRETYDFKLKREINAIKILAVL